MNKELKNNYNLRKLTPGGVLSNLPGITAYKVWYAALQPDGSSTTHRPLSMLGTFSSND